MQQTKTWWHGGEQLAVMLPMLLLAGRHCRLSTSVVCISSIYVGLCLGGATR
jgi:hypothetical protein